MLWRSCHDLAWYSLRKLVLHLRSCQDHGRSTLRPVQLISRPCLVWYHCFKNYKYMYSFVNFCIHWIDDVRAIGQSWSINEKNISNKWGNYHWFSKISLHYLHLWWCLWSIHRRCHGLIKHIPCDWLVGAGRWGGRSSPRGTSWVTNTTNCMHKFYIIEFATQIQSC